VTNTPLDNPLKTARRIAAVALIVVATPGHADTARWTGLGFRGGVTASNHLEEDLQQYEVFAVYRLPWSWQWSSGLRLDTRLEITAGALTGGGDTGFVGSIGPDFVLTKAGVAVGIGISPTLLSRSEFGVEDVGGTFHFTSHIRIGYRLTDHWEFSYRFQHMSNAGIEEPNPGVDLHTLQLGYHF
jgi:hypothetical protein